MHYSDPDNQTAKQVTEGKVAEAVTKARAQIDSAGIGYATVPKELTVEEHLRQDLMFHQRRCAELVNKLDTMVPWLKELPMSVIRNLRA